MIDYKVGDIVCIINDFTIPSSMKVGDVFTIVKVSVSTMLKPRYWLYVDRERYIISSSVVYAKNAIVHNLLTDLLSDSTQDTSNQEQSTL